MCLQGQLPQHLLRYAYRLGAIGVFLFFAVSGFIMVLTNRDRFGQPRGALDFFVRRLIRIWPMYFIATMVVFAVRHGADPLYSVENLLKSIVFIPYIGAEDLYRPILGKGWTLNYEMFFYCVFATCLCLPRTLGLAVTAAVLFVLGISQSGAAGGLWGFYADTVVLYFLIGVALGCLVTAPGLRLPHSCSATVAVIISSGAFISMMFVGRISSTPWVITVFTLALIFVSLYAVAFPDTRFNSLAATRVAATLGDSSYSLYLFHGFVLVAMKPVLSLLSSVPSLVQLLLVCATATVACAAVHLYAEKPVSALLMGFYRRAAPCLHGRVVRADAAV